MLQICITNQRTPENLLRHIKTVHLLSSEDATRIEREIFICNECSKIFFNKRMLIVHMAVRHRNVRSKKQRIECPKCLKLIRCNTMWSHCQFEDILSIACCSICLTKLKNTTEMQRHIISTHPSYFYCNICTYNTKSETYFKEHVSKHKNKFKQVDNVDKLKIEQCFISSIRYMQWRLLRLSSFKGLNLPPNINVCIICREICRNTEEMKKHYLSHIIVERPVEKKKHICICGEEFFNSVVLKHHVFKMQGEHRAL